MDILTDIIRLMRPQAISWRTVEAQGRWGLSVPCRDLPVYFLVVTGQCWYVPRHGQPLYLHQGDYLLIRATARYCLVSDLEATKTLHAKEERVASDEYVRWDEGLGGDTVRLVGGYFEIGPEHTALFSGMLPDFLHIRSSDEEAGRLSRLIALIGEESSCNLSGRDLVMSRLVEIMLVEVWRRPLNKIDVREAGWFSGMADPHIHLALQKIHADVARHWTVDLLAKEVSMSRAVFARRFAERVGVAPATYLSNWRIALAKDALLNSERSITDIALSIGYYSDSAFSTAFSRTVGVAPAAFRRARKSEQAARQ
ncbi:AraC family transcriptional regulator [Paraburkholderia hospita]|jgi:AraC-like DNA-binding protein|uniref:AraC family transcriptional regulator n=1 Tax=Paraburkholderia hospita TaxID=169430 RepID=A0AAN1MME9_9BURK|nr:AraC family transcriptional regulator [Paraburkholderia hospita]AUT72412.1 AraC family transcriptional regulator [Paraburkholderia hospita]OUL70720.1 AraC family transcriptional regulator [Paraburkholderia hospita]OUL75579.1 AraC family transcriptional regulator [Paraburkholderia hospita]SEI01232.1 AraC-type DNA-binding protein [Paraburkholderia hospita]